MDLDDAQLHPNWLALATVTFPRKRFVRGLELQSNEENKVEEIKAQLCGEGRGEDVRIFYEELTKHSKTSVPTTAPTMVSGSFNSMKPTFLKFDSNKFFRLATTNNVTELARINYQACDVDVCDAFGWTALMMAACEGAIDAVRFLLQLGANKNVKEKTGRTARDYAIEKGYDHIATILQKNVEDIEEHASQKVSSATVSIEPFYCTSCEHTFTNTTRLRHETSTVHQFSTKAIGAQNKLNKFNISNKNRGLQLMVKQGWDKESGLGPTQAGRLYPVKTVIRKKRTGLGTKQEPARVTHFDAFDKQAVMHNRSSNLPKSRKRSRCDIRSEKLRDWKRERRLRKALS
ncbi:PREDICTED: G patch domain and ankyrin repeat-containing protein 1 homolog [Bactrocera latifrons]|uniref:G patch domain and ankyrin repeat-containing protein 1 n=1 Tax=Bactrocera latifrons TaxID=174628 RepID=A0A0K8TZ98_BACLA|nr:PREDICTED: G patch domain and ankyrin repeat-containing protein 1 homolog [Bactrocera latifrons]